MPWAKVSHFDNAPVWDIKYLYAFLFWLMKLCYIEWETYTLSLFIDIWYWKQIYKLSKDSETEMPTIINPNGFWCMHIDYNGVA